MEDEPLLADTIAGGLRRRAMAVDVAYDGDTASSDSQSTTTTSWYLPRPADHLRRPGLHGAGELR